MKKLLKIPRILGVSMVKLYQKTLSPDHSWLKVFFPNGHCRFQPTCSEYTSQSIAKYGIIKGSYLGSKRILRCNPFNKGGHDPVK